MAASVPARLHDDLVFDEALHLAALSRRSGSPAHACRTELLVSRFEGDGRAHGVERFARGRTDCRQFRIHLATVSALVKKEGMALRTALSFLLSCPGRAGDRALYAEGLSLARVGEQLGRSQGRWRTSFRRHQRRDNHGEPATQTSVTVA